MLTHNVTVNPRAPAPYVEKPEVAEILDLQTAEHLSTSEFFASHTYEEVVILRNSTKEAIKNGQPRFACAICETPVKIIASKEKNFFFRHEVNDGSCPAQTDGELSREEIQRRKYHGLRESAPHKHLKYLIYRSLLADPAFSSSDSLIERRWKSLSDPSRWKQPDVQAVSDGKRFVFEAQLSTTFLDVVVERRKFYKAEGALLVWVLNHFDPNDRRMTIDDVLFPNNSNVFVVDEETASISQTKGVFHLRCHYRRPLIDHGVIKDRWESQIVQFAGLTYDIQSQQIFYFDFRSEEDRLRLKIDSDLRDKFFQFWGDGKIGSLGSLEEWEELIFIFERRDVSVPEYEAIHWTLRPLINGILSATTGIPVGWNFQKLIQVAHHLAEHHPEHLVAFGCGLDISGHASKLLEQDAKGKWANRKREIWEEIKANDPLLTQSEHWIPLLRLVFPQIGDRLTTVVENHRFDIGSHGYQRVN